VRVEEVVPKQKKIKGEGTMGKDKAPSNISFTTNQF